MILYIGCSDKNDIIITDDSETGEEQAMEDENDDTADEESEGENEEESEEESDDEESEEESEEESDDQNDNTGDEENEEESEEEEGENDNDDESSECDSLIWSDEFEGNRLDDNKWRYQRGGWNGSNVQNCYVDENTSVYDGTLKITAKYEPGYNCYNETKDFTSGFVQTKDRVAWSYGYFEARVKVPASNSTWPAFWLSPQEAVYGEWPRSGEIDVFEIKGHDMTKSYGNAHWGESGGNKRQEKGTFTFGDASQWHIYAVEWTEGELKFYIDGEYYHTINDFKAPNATTHPGPFNIDFYIRLNMAVGGNYLSEPHNDAYNNIEQLPAVMEVDYVRVYSKKPDC